MTQIAHGAASAASALSAINWKPWCKETTLRREVIPSQSFIFHSQISEWTHVFIDHCFISEEHWPKAAQHPAGFIWCPADDGYFLPGWVIYLSGAVGTQEFLTLAGNFEKCGLQEYERKEHNRTWWTRRAQSFKNARCVFGGGAWMKSFIWTAISGWLHWSR